MPISNENCKKSQDKEQELKMTRNPTSNRHEVCNFFNSGKLYKLANIEETFQYEIVDTPSEKPSY